MAGRSGQNFRRSFSGIKTIYIKQKRLGVHIQSFLFPTVMKHDKNLRIFELNKNNINYL